ncbi:fungal-specific transcription factor domain-containing protein [Mycena leptocephala]|nr:fungal-specific transcription factor domain-containing protein [Mycena leptocephala]
MSAEKQVKRRRLHGSCDTCKKKKIRCNSSEMPGERCTNCVTSKIECTHTGSKGSEQPTVHSWNTAQEHVAKVLSTSTVYIPPNDPNVSHAMLVEVAKYARELEETVAGLRRTVAALQREQSPSNATSRSESTTSPDSTALILSSTPGSETRDSSVDPDEPMANLIQSSFEKVQRYFGGCLGPQFLKAAAERLYGSALPALIVRRPNFWGAQPWEKLPVDQIFPENDLLKTLVDIYFEDVNPIFGILHSPSFRQSISDGAHLRDPHFGAVVLAVCSLASRYSDDPRVFLDGVASEHSCGLKWFQQLRLRGLAFSAECSLYQLQLICLSLYYHTTMGTAAPGECENLAGVGIRFSYAAGVHRRSGYSRMDPLTAELYKRVFWSLVILDTVINCCKGKSSIAQSGDFDLDLPLACDEEYWGIPNAVQPPDQLSHSVFRVTYVQLMLIFRRIQEAVYPESGQLCSQDVVAELDSALNSWLDLIPAHLRWDPNQQNQTFLNQSAALGIAYYHAQLLIHRPFIPRPGKQSASNTKYNSLAICANAARSCGHVLDIQARSGRLLFQPTVTVILFDCALVLLINVWAIGSGNTPQTPGDFNRAAADVQTCTRILRLYEQRWRPAGRNYDIISTMLNVGKYTADAASRKRPRDVEVEAPSVSEVAINPAEERPRAGSSESISVGQQIQELERSLQETQHLFALPIRTDELGRLPVYDPFQYEFTFHYQPDFGNGQAASGVLQPELFRTVDPVIGLNSVIPPQHHVQW